MSRAWDLLSPSRQYRLWLANSDRVPPGWQPALKKAPHKKRRPVKAWDELSFSFQVKLYNERSPRVPPGWKPDPELEKPLVSKLAKPWDELCYALQYKLWKKGSARVPADWQPKQTTRGKRQPWEELSLSRKLTLFKQGSPRVPPGWQPPQSKHYVPGLKASTTPRVKPLSTAEWLAKRKQQWAEYHAAKAREAREALQPPAAPVPTKRVKSSTPVYHGADEFESTQFPAAIIIELTPELSDFALLELLRSYEANFICPQVIKFARNGHVVAELPNPLLADAATRAIASTASKNFRGSDRPKIAYLTELRRQGLESRQLASSAFPAASTQQVRSRRLELDQDQRR